MTNTGGLLPDPAFPLPYLRSRESLNQIRPLGRRAGVWVLHRPRSELMCLGRTHITRLGASSIRRDQDSDSAHLNQLPLVGHYYCIISSRLRFSCYNSEAMDKVLLLLRTTAPSVHQF